MNKVVTISLNGSAFQLEEAAYDALRAYLDQAHLTLGANPDRDEIMRDLEQAIAEKLSRLMRPHFSVANEAQVRQALSEMGPVEGGGTSSNTGTQAASGPKKLYRLPERAIFGGVCAGLAAYFDLDTTLVRLIFVALTILTGGGWILLYFIMIMFVPSARTPQEKAHAEGAPFNAEEIVRRAHESFEQLKKSGLEWKRYAREQKQWAKAQKRAWKWHSYGEVYPAPVRVYHHASVLGELFQVAIIVAILWAVYTYIPATRHVYQYVGSDIQQGWAWLNTEVAS